MKRILFTLALLCLASSLLAASKITVKTNAFGTYDFAGKHFYIIPASPDINPKDAEFKDYANHVASMFRYVGAIEVSDPEMAEVCVLIDYLITNESYIERIPVPIRKAVGSVTSTHISTDKQQGSQSYDSQVNTKSIKSKTHEGNSYAHGDYLATVAHRQIYETVGYKTEEREVNGYRRILNVYAYDNVDNDGDPDMLWKCNMMSFGSRSNLNSIIPAMTYINLFSPGKRITNHESWVNDEYGWALYEAYSNVMKDYSHAHFPGKFVGDNATVYFAAKNRDALTVTVRQAGPGKRIVTENTYVEINGEQYPISSVNHIKMNRTVRVSKDDNVYFTMTFLGVPDDFDSFDIVCPDKYTWRNIPLH